MQQRGIKRDLTRAMAHASRQIRALREAGDVRIHGPSGAGSYAGGYRDALSDVEQAIRGVPPSNSCFWPRKRDS
jgi:hypothetical protein